MNDTEVGEAYLLGCLYARGSIEQNQSDYSFIFRIPYHRHNPLGIKLIDILQENTGVRAKDFKKHVSQEIDVRQIARALKILKGWHPPHKEVGAPLIDKTNDGWGITNEDLIGEYLGWEEKYKDREYKSMSFVMTHLENTARELSDNIQIKPEESSFSVNYLTIRCNIPSLLYKKLKSEYNLDVGEVYRHARVSRNVFDFPQEAIEEFTRGIADASVHFDRMPLWPIYPDRLWHLRFGAVNSNPGLTYDICRLIQDKLDRAVFVINWAAVGKNKSKHKRGGRDHFVEVWALNFRDFEPRLFYNTWKQEEFEKCIETDTKILKKQGLNLKAIPQLKKCPRGGRLKKYMKTCITFNCSKISSTTLDEFLGETDE